MICSDCINIVIAIELMLPNPYQSPKTTRSTLAAVAPIPTYRVLALTLLFIALAVAMRQLPPLFARPVSSWPLRDWQFAFLPSVYFLIAAVYSLLTEFKANHALASRLWLVLLPLVGVTGLILIATASYVRNWGIGFLNDWRVLSVLAICPVVWCFFTLSIYRWRTIALRHPATQNHE